ncbi:SapB/AmfS family lanthipeptide [Streptomyces sp. NPDC002838]
MVLLDLQGLEPEQHTDEDPGAIPNSIASVVLCNSAASIALCL